MPFGMAVAMAAAPAVAVIGWRGLWLAMAGLLAVYALLAQIFLPRPAHDGGAPPGGRPGTDLLAAIKAPGPLLLAVTFATYTAAYITLTGFLPSLLIDRMGLSAGTAGLLAAAVTAANMIGNLATGPLLGAGVPRWVPILVASLTIAGCAPLIFAQGTAPGLAYGLALVVSAVGGLLPGSVLGGVAALAPLPRLVPVTLGLAMQGSNLGQVVGPAAAGLWVAAAGWPAAGWTMSGLGLAGCGLALVLRRLQATPRSDPTSSV
jgi:predicted MFS family arabinose efflux permease